MLTKRILILLPAAAAWAVAVLLVASPAAKATVRSWNGGTSAEWNNAANWGGGVVPGSGDIAEFKTKNGWGGGRRPRARRRRFRRPCRARSAASPGSRSKISK